MQIMSVKKSSWETIVTWNMSKSYIASDTRLYLL